MVVCEPRSADSITRALIVWSRVLAHTRVLSLRALMCHICVFSLCSLLRRCVLSYVVALCCLHMCALSYLCFYMCAVTAHLRVFSCVCSRVPNLSSSLSSSTDRCLGCFCSSLQAFINLLNHNLPSEFMVFDQSK